MLRKRKDNSDYEIDRELTWKFAIEKNAEYQEKIEQLEEENWKLLARLKQEERKKKSVMANRDYWKDKAEKLQKENIELRNRLDAYELALNIWSKWQSELLMWKNYENQFENWMPKYKSDLFK